MGKLPTFVLIAALVLGGQFWLRAAWSDPVHGQVPVGQTPPETVLGQDDEATYKLFTPESVVTGGLPGQSGAAGECLKTTGSDLQWDNCGGSDTPLSDQTPEDLGTADAGTGTAASRDDHVHKRPTEIADNTAAIAVNAADIARKPGLSGDDPKPVGNAAMSGSGTKASRADHAHAFANYGTAVKAVAAASSAGVLDQASRVDHVHAAAALGHAPLRLVAVDRLTGRADSFTFAPPIENLTMFISSQDSGSMFGQMPAKGDSTLMAYPRGTCQIDRSTANVFTANSTTLCSADKLVVRFLDTAVVGGSGSGGATNLSDATPKPVSLTGAQPGTLGVASRGDHVHTYGTGARFVSDPEAAGVMDGWVLTVAGQGIYGWAAPTGGGSGGSSTFLGLTDTPSAFTGQKGKITAVNADENALSFVNAPPDLTDDVNGNTGAIEALDFLTQDLIAGVPSTGWATVTDVSNAGIAVFSGAASCSPARAATYTPSVSSAGGKYPVVRVKAGFATANVRTLITGQGTATDLVSGWALLCTSSDGSFAFYHPTVDGQTEAFGTGVSTAAVQTTGGAHIGTSKYQGDPTKVERWAIVGNATHIPAGKAYPAITGQAGKVLTVN
ncbi:MAG: hypothetical protein F4Y04_03710, partial [Chloroflexi bacterium]|nr:hypothetical protein [Chloroflexota bacterium]